MRRFAPFIHRAAAFARNVSFVLFPCACASCGRPLLGGDVVCFCQACWYLATGHAPARPMPAPRRAPFSHILALGTYDGPLREAIRQFKFRGRWRLARPLAEALWDRFPGEIASCDALVPVPLSRVRRADRGFNQSLLLARRLAHASGVPLLARALRKRRDTPPQSTLARVERLSNVADAYRLGRRAAFPGARVLLVDDVYTTGATLSECSRLLLGAGASNVVALAVAYRPLT